MKTVKLIPRVHSGRGRLSVLILLWFLFCHLCYRRTLPWSIPWALRTWHRILPGQTNKHLIAFQITEQCHAASAPSDQLVNHRRPPAHVLQVPYRLSWQRTRIRAESCPAHVPRCSHCLWMGIQVHTLIIGSISGASPTFAHWLALVLGHQYYSWCVCLCGCFVQVYFLKFNRIICLLKTIGWWCTKRAMFENVQYYSKARDVFRFGEHNPITAMRLDSPSLS